MSVSFSVALPRDPSASRVARGAVRQRLGGTLTPSKLDDVTLAVSELVTNAVVHGTGDIELRVETDGRVVKGEVIDGGHGLEDDVRQDAVDGRGLRIVAQLATKWGVFQGTTHVWFEILVSTDSDHPVDPAVGRPPAAERP
jgi:anti-sigma regulatory factor (Ser/Thr protein kinase)